MDKITTISNIGEILERWPHIAKIFLEHQMNCPGCYLSSFENLADALEIYGVPVEWFVNNLNEAIETPE
jgi:hybrid cluster-associated redox disulfide protein